MALQSSGTMLYSGFVTIYGGVSTVTYTTTITASDLYSPANITVLSWPSPTTTEPIEYTSVAIPTDPASKYFPNPLPIFVATEVDSVVVNTAGQTIATIIEVQAQPAYVYGAPVGDTGTECIGNYYICWSTGKKAAIIFSIILGGLLFLVFIFWFCCFMRIPRSRKSDEEGHSMRTRDRGQGPDGVGGSQRKRVRNSDPDSVGRQGRKRIKRRHSSLSSGSLPEPPKPLPRVVTAQDYREIRRVASVPQHVLSSETSSGSTGRRAVVGVGVRETHMTAARDTTTARNTAGAFTAATAFNAATASGKAPQATPELDTPEREIRRDSGNHANIDQKQRGRSRILKRSSRNGSPRPQSYSTHHQSDSPPTDNRSSFAPYIPVAVAALERFEESLIQNDQGRSRGRSSEPEARSQRRSLREDNRASRQHRHHSSFDLPRSSRTVEQELSMSGGRGDSPSASPPPIPRKSSRRRLSNYV